MAGKVEGTIPLRGGAGVLPALLVYWSGRTGGPIALYLLAIFISFQLFLLLLFVYPFTPISTSSPFPSFSGTTFYLWTLAILAKRLYLSFPGRFPLAGSVAGGRQGVPKVRNAVLSTSPGPGQP